MAWVVRLFGNKRSWEATRTAGSEVVCADFVFGVRESG